MKLLTVFASSLVFCSAAVAQSLVVCPATLTCNYDTGKCDMPSGGWVLDPSQATQSFSGSKTMNISRIWAVKQGEVDYQFECTYNYGRQYSAISIYTYVQSLTGENWGSSGFGQSQAECSQPTAPDTCTGLASYW